MYVYIIKFYTNDKIIDVVLYDNDFKHTISLRSNALLKSLSCSFMTLVTPPIRPFLMPVCISALGHFYFHSATRSIKQIEAEARKQK